MELEKGCPCCKVTPYSPYYNDGLEFKKVMHLESAGLVIYRHTTPVNSVASVSQPEKAVDTKDNVYIIHNTKNINMSATNYMSEFEQAINCPRCRYIAKHTKELLLSVPFIRKKDVIGICDHCRFKRRIIERCTKCQEVIREFLKKQELKQTETCYIDKHENLLISKIKDVLKDAPKAVQIGKSKTLRGSETSMKNRSLGNRTSPKHHVPRVKDMFDNQKKTEKYYQQIKKGFLRQIGSTKLYKNQPDSEISFIEAKRRQEHNGPRRNILFNSAENIAWPESSKESAEFIGLDNKHQHRLRQKLKPKLEMDLTLKRQPSTELRLNPDTIFSNEISSEDYLRNENNIFIRPDHEEQKWPSAEQSILEKENIKNKKKYQHSYDDIHNLKYDKKVTKPSQYKGDIYLRGIQKQSKSDYNIRRYSSEETVLKSASTATEQKIHKDFSYYFIKESDVVQKPPRQRVSSSELIKDTQDMYRARAEEEKIKKELELKLYLETEEKNKLAKIERKRLLEEEKRLVELRKKEEADKNKSKKRDEGQDLNKKKILKRDIESEEKSVKTSKEPSEKSKIIKLKTEIKESKTDKSLKSERDSVKSKNEIARSLKSERDSVKSKKEIDKQEKEELKRLEKERKLKEKSEKEEQMRKAKEEKQKQKDKEKEIAKEIAKKEVEMRRAKEERHKQKEMEKETAKKEEEMRKAKEEQMLIPKEKKLRQKEDKEGDGAKKEERKKKEKNRQEKIENENVSKENEEKTNQKAEPKKQKDKESKVSKKQEEQANNMEAKLKLKSLKETKAEVQPEKPESQKVIEEPKLKELNLNQVKIRKSSADDLILQMVKLKQKGVRNERPTRMSQINIAKKDIYAHKGHKYKTDDCIICLDSDLDMDIDNIVLNETKPEEINDIIIGKKIFRHKFPMVTKKEEEEKSPLLYSLTYTEGENIIKTQEVLHIVEENKRKPPILSAKYVDQEVPKGLIRYALSDRTFIEKGWTMLPTEKVVRKMNVYRMRPAHPEFDWFEHNKNRKLISYDTGEKLAEFDDNGKGRWFYRSGKVALDYYDAEEINAQQRIIIFSSGEPDERGCSRPFAILATFDYLGNGIVFDHSGKIRLKYNQTEGVVLDRAIGPTSHWKWHTLNDPPVLQQVMIDTQMAHKDPDILKLGGPQDKQPSPENEEMLAIEFDNFIKEKSKKLSQKFKPFQIKMKALKINEYFSLKVLDQATIYLIYRDGSTNLKLNIGMILDHQEIVDTDIAEVGEVSNSLERFPARTDSLARLQRSVAHAQRVERARLERSQRLRPVQPSASADRLTAALARPLPAPLDHCPCKCRKPPTNNLYYDTRLI